MRSVLELIEEHRPKMSKGHKKIADYIIGNYDKAAFLTASKLGVEVGVSESTVVRFANSLGYSGFPELQDSLGEVVKTRLTSLQRYNLTFDKMANKDILSKVITADISMLKDTLEHIDKEHFDKSIDAILNAKTIYILGIRSSYSLAQYLGFYMNLTFNNVKVVYTNTMSEMFEQTFRIDRDDVIIGITFPRYSKRTCKILQYARNRGAVVIGITDTEQSPIIPYCNYKLLAVSDMVSFVDSLVAPLSLVNALAVAVGIKKKEEVTETLNKLEEIWDEYSVYDNGKNDR